MFGMDFSRDPESCGRSRVRRRRMATVGIQAGFVEEAPSQTGEGRLWEREEQEQRQGVCGIAPGEKAECWVESRSRCQDVACTLSL